MGKSPFQRTLSLVGDVCFVVALALLFFLAADPVTILPGIEEQVLEERP